MIAIFPPNDGEGSEEESGDDEECDINHLNRAVLLSNVDRIEDEDDLPLNSTSKNKKVKTEIMYHSELCDKSFEIENEISNIELGNESEPVNYFYLFF